MDCTDPSLARGELKDPAMVAVQGRDRAVAALHRGGRAMHYAVTLEGKSEIGCSPCEAAPTGYQQPAACLGGVADGAVQTAATSLAAWLTEPCRLPLLH